MSRRVSMPAADDLFRPTAEHAGPAVRAVPDPPAQAGKEPEKEAQKGPSGRVRHDEKITVYVSSEELLALEHLRLELRAEHGIAVDRGRIVRAAVALAVADLDATGEDSDLIRQLDES